MSKNILQYIVIVLGILIILAFIALIYGMYLKISSNNIDLSSESEQISLSLSQGEKIIDIKIIDKSSLLIIIESHNLIKGGIYNLDQKKIIEFIEK